MPPAWDRALKVEWLWNARRDFISKVLGISAGGAELGAKRPVVAFYGPSQVGKTGIILRLLGLAEKHHAEIESVLRGGRQAGDSATVTALRYTASSDDTWEVPALVQGPKGIEVRQRKQPDNEAACKAFKELRHALTVGGQGRFVPEDPLPVGIPLRLFGRDVDRETIPVMVDLPGEGSSDLSEQTHVPLLVRKWLQCASSIVVVLRLENIVQLSRLRFGGEQDNGWLFWPGDLVVVTTYALSAESIRGSLGRRTDLGSLRVLIREQGNLEAELVRHGGSDQQELARRRIGETQIFPAEFGGSLATFKRQHPEKFGHSESALEASMAELTECIRRNASAESALLAMSGLRLAVASRFQAKLADAQAKVQKVAENRSRLLERRQKKSNDLVADQAGLHSLNESKLELEAAATRVPGGVRDAVERCYGAMVQNASWVAFSPNQMAAFAADLQRELPRAAIKELGAEDFSRVAPSIRAGSLPAISGGLSKHTFGSWYGFDSTRRTDWETIKSNAKQLAIDAAAQAQASARMNCDASVSELTQKGRSLESGIKSLEADLRDLQANLKATEVEEQRAESDRRRLQEEAARARQAAEAKDPFLINAREAFQGQRERWTLSKATKLSGLEHHAALAAWTASVMKMQRLEAAVDK
jgi:hypothetical protein